jgi:hypothetical protein
VLRVAGIKVYVRDDVEEKFRILAKSIMVMARVPSARRLWRPFRCG